MLSDVIVAFDHLKHTVTILANAYVDEDDVEAAHARAVERDPPRSASAWPARCRAPSRTPARPEPQFESEHAARGVRGDGRPHRRVRPRRRRLPGRPVASAGRRPAPVEPFSIYRGLRAVNPSPYMYFLDFEDFQIVGASPEPLLTVSGRRVSTRPIAGTRPRGATPTRTSAIAAELLADEKERAEHVMLVDLGRNDLGRVCEYGTRRRSRRSWRVETYSHVIHIVSSVARHAARRRSARSTRCARVLPAGTLSGAPKVRAMEIIDELEPVKRGAYGGAVGWLSYAGELDTCICIRTVVVKDGVAHIQAGGGTVADAKPDYEYEESRAKARGVVRAIELAAQAGGVAVRVLMVDNYDSFTYNLVQYLGELGAELEVVRNDAATVDELLEPRLRPRRRLARPVHAERGRDLASRSCAASPRPGVPTLGVCLGHQSLGAGVRRQGRPPRAGARQDDRDRRTTARACSRACRARCTVGALSLARRRPRPARRARARPPAAAAC